MEMSAPSLHQLQRGLPCKIATGSPTSSEEKIKAGLPSHVRKRKYCTSSDMLRKRVLGRDEISLQITHKPLFMRSI